MSTAGLCPPSHNRRCAQKKLEVELKLVSLISIKGNVAKRTTTAYILVNMHWKPIANKLIANSCQLNIKHRLPSCSQLLQRSLVTRENIFW